MVYIEIFIKVFFEIKGFCKNYVWLRDNYGGNVNFIFYICVFYCILLEFYRDGIWKNSMIGEGWEGK